MLSITQKKEEDTPFNKWNAFKSGHFIFQNTHPLWWKIYIPQKV
jgi:hypothetical protein